jgi:hypothetical protein
MSRRCRWVGDTAFVLRLVPEFERWYSSPEHELGMLVFRMLQSSLVTVDSASLGHIPVSSSRCTVACRFARPSHVTAKVKPTFGVKFGDTLTALQRETAKA